MDKSEKIMTDINKMIEWLKESEAIATPGLWQKIEGDNQIFSGVPFVPAIARFSKEADAIMVTIMRNALPELLAELERRDTRAEKAEAERDVLLQHIAKLSCDVCPAHECPGICSCEDYIAEWAEREAASTGQQSEAEGREEA